MATAKGKFCHKAAITRAEQHRPGEMPGFLLDFVPLLLENLPRHP